MEMPITAPFPRECEEVGEEASLLDAAGALMLCNTEEKVFVGGGAEMEEPLVEADRLLLNVWGVELECAEELVGWRGGLNAEEDAGLLLRLSTEVLEVAAALLIVPPPHSRWKCTNEQREFEDMVAMSSKGSQNRINGRKQLVCASNVVQQVSINLLRRVQQYRGTVLGRVRLVGGHVVSRFRDAPEGGALCAISMLVPVTLTQANIRPSILKVFEFSN
jgi:hypothetical protein